MSTATPEQPPEKPQKEETLAERSARLEAEAQALAEQQAHFDQDADPLAPEPHPEDTGSFEDSAEHYNEEQSTVIIKSLQDELDKAKDQTARALADAENTRRRAKKDREDASKYSVSSFAKDLLEVSDNLRRALDAVPTDLLDSEPRLKNLVDGIEATERTLLRTFEKHGIQKLEPLDKPFDPNFHEVMFEAPAPGKSAGFVMQVVEPGYILHDRLLRPARVGVTKDDGGSAGGDTPHPGGTIDTEA